MRTRIRMSFLVPIFVLCVFVGRNQMGLPDELSSEIPPYPGAEIASTMRLKAPAGAHASLRMNATPAKILRFYRNALKSKGWSIRVERESFLALFKDNMGLMIDAFFRGPVVSVLVSQSNPCSAAYLAATVRRSR